MTIINGPGRYRMRNGREAVVSEIFEGRAYGRKYEPDYKIWTQWNWFPRGNCHAEPTSNDIISPWVDPPKPIEGWVNVCHTNSRVVFGLHLHKSRSDAEADGMGTDARTIYVREVVPPEGA